MRLTQPPILFISDRRLSIRPLTEQFSLAAEGGCRWFMIREKDLDLSDLESLIVEIKDALYGWPVFITLNGCPELVKRLRLPGLHLPQGEDVRSARRCVGNETLIGISAHSMDELRKAEDAGADYVTLSPVFVSTSKGAYRRPMGLEAFKRLSSSTPLPVIALGGVTVENLKDLFQAGADGAALLGPAMCTPEPQKLAMHLMSIWQEAS